MKRKYLPVLEALFGIDQSYFGRELSEIDQLEIQKEKLKRDLKPVINKHEQQFYLGEINDLVEVPIYDKEEINAIERDIEKAKLVSKFKAAMDIVENKVYDNESGDRLSDPLLSCDLCNANAAHAPRTKKYANTTSIRT